MAIDDNYEYYDVLSAHMLLDEVFFNLFEFLIFLFQNEILLFPSRRSNQ